MKKILISVILTVMTLALAAPVLAVTPDSARLIADGRDAVVDAGSLTIAIDGDTLTVTFAMEGESDWLLDETHLYIGDEAPEKNAPGRFPYKDDVLGGIESHSYEVSLGDVDDGDGIVYVAAHAALIMQDGEDPTTQEPVYIYESSWAQIGGEDDLPFGKGKNWATCFIVDLSG